MLVGVDVDEVALDAAARIVERARRQGVTLAVEPSDGYEVRGDASLLTQLVLNLLENALRHTPAGGRITLAVDPAEDGVSLVVADTGSGIARRAPAAPLRAVLPGGPGAVALGRRLRAGPGDLRVDREGPRRAADRRERGRRRHHVPALAAPVWPPPAPRPPDAARDPARRRMRPVRIEMSTTIKRRAAGLGLAGRVPAERLRARPAVRRPCTGLRIDAGRPGPARRRLHVPGRLRRGAPEQPPARLDRRRSRPEARRGRQRPLAQRRPTRPASTGW